MSTTKTEKIQTKDSSKLLLLPMQSQSQLKKKELTAIRKAARALKDPGTTNTTTACSSSGPPPPFLPPHATAAAATTTTEKQDNPSSTAPANETKTRQVFLYNWKQQKPLKPRSHHHYLSTSSDTATLDTSAPDSPSPRPPLHSKIPRKQRPSLILRCRDTTALATPSMRRAIANARKRKSSSNKTTSAAALLRNRQLNTAAAASRSSSSQIDQSYDDTEHDCSLSQQDFERHPSAASPLLPRLRHDKNNNWSQPSSGVLKRSSRNNEQDSSYAYSTPALSTSSYNNHHAIRNSSTVASWDATTASLQDNDQRQQQDEEDDDDDHMGLPGSQGCGIPCYWSKRTPPKYRGASGGSCYSPSFSDTLRRKGGSILCGSQTMYSRSRQPSKRRAACRSVQEQGLRFNNYHATAGLSSIGIMRSDDELSSNFGELDLEALSRLDGQRWSAGCRSQEGLEIIALNGNTKGGQGTPDSIMSLSSKYMPMFFSEIIGQNTVVQSLTNAISRCRIAPVYIFQGPRGTGKTSVARIFAAALNCEASEATKPCGTCNHCNAYISNESRYLVEVDGTDKKAIDQIRLLWRTMYKESAGSYKVFVVDECHLLPSKTWLMFLKFLEEPPSRVVFVFIAADLDCVPHAITSRCQKYTFNRLKDGDIVNRLRQIVAEENLDVELDAMDLIALNADGSLRDAETMLDQLSLLGRKITANLVHELVGVVSDENLLELLELALSSDTAETVKKARELMDSGLDPMVLTSQLASLIMDIIAGTYQIVDAAPTDLALGGRSLTEAELERLKMALKLLSDAEKQLRISSDRATWFTATLLQLGSASCVDISLSGSSRRQSSKTTEEDPSTVSREACSRKLASSDRFISHKSSSSDSSRKDVPLLAKSPNSKPMLGQLMDGNISGALQDDALFKHSTLGSVDSKKLDVIWKRCIEKCHSNTLRQLLYTHGTLLSLSEEKGLLVAHIAFRNASIKSRAERFLSSIMNSFGTVLRCSVEIRMTLLLNGDSSVHGIKSKDLPENLQLKQMGKFLDNKVLDQNRDVSCEFPDHSDCSPVGSASMLAEVNAKMNQRNGMKQGAPMQRIESIIREQRLETAWLQAVEKSASGSMSRTRPEKNQVLPQEGMQHSMESMESAGIFNSQEVALSGTNEAGIPQMDQLSKRSDRYSMSPSLLHDHNFARSRSKENMGYESGSGTGGCGRLFCWNRSKPYKQQGKVNQGTPVGSHRNGRFIWLGDCCILKTKRIGSSGGRR